jgi:outer membrane beta-barrel protein
MSAIRRGIFPAALCMLLWAPTAVWAEQEEETEAEARETVERGVDVGPLRDRVAPVTGNFFSKKGRFEISPSLTFTLRDAFYTKYIVGATLAYHFSDSWAIAIRGGYSFPVVSGAAQICTTEATVSGAVRGCRLPHLSELDGKAPGQINFLGGADVYWEPLYGKIALWSELFVHLDFYVVGGPALIVYSGPTSNGTAGSQPYFTAGGNIGIGTRIFLTKWLTLRGEFRDILYVEKVSSGNGSSFRNQLVFELGVSFFLPSLTGTGS